MFFVKFEPSEFCGIPNVRKNKYCRWQGGKQGRLWLTSQHVGNLWCDLSRKTQVLLFLNAITWLDKVKEEAFLLLIR